MGSTTAQATASTNSYTIQGANIQTFGMSDQQIQTEMQNYESSVMDSWLAYVSNGFIAQFQQIGESLATTMGRIMTDAVSVKYAFDSVGASLNNLSQTNLINFSEAMVNTAGSLSNLTSALNDVVTKINTPAINTKASLDSINSSLNTVINATGQSNASVLKNAGIDLSPITSVVEQVQAGDVFTPDKITAMNTAFSGLVGQLTTLATSTTGAESYNTPAAAAAAANAFTPTYTPSAGEPNLNQLVNQNTNTQQAQATATWNQVSNGNWNTATWANLGSSAGASGAQWAQLIQQNANTASPTQYLYQEMVKTLDANTALAQQGVTQLAALNLPTTQGAFNAGKTAETSANQPILDAVNAVIGAVNNFSTALTNQSQLSKTDIGIQESVLSKVTDTQQTNMRGYISGLQSDVANGDNVVIPNNQLDQTTLDLFNQYNQALLNFNTQLPASIQMTTGLNQQVLITGESMQALADILTQVAAKSKDAQNAVNTLENFNTSVVTWAAQARVTQVGTPASQMAQAQQNFANQQSIIQNSSDATAVQTALGSITQYADTYISAIKSYYGTSQDGQTAINNVISQVENLSSAVPISQLQLNVLTNIEQGISQLAPQIASALTPTESAAFTTLQNQINAAQSAYVATPTQDNQLIVQSLAQLMNSLSNAANNGVSGSALDSLMSTVADKTNGILASINATISSATLSEAAKQALVADLTSTANSIALNVTNVALNPNNATMASQLQTELNQLGGKTGFLMTINGLITSSQVDSDKTTIAQGLTTYLTGLGNGATAQISTISDQFTQLESKAPSIPITLQNVPTVTTQITGLVNNLSPLNNQSYNSVVNVDTSGAVTSIQTLGNTTTVTATAMNTSLDAVSNSLVSTTAQNNALSNNLTNTTTITNPAVIASNNAVVVSFNQIASAAQAAQAAMAAQAAAPVVASVAGNPAASSSANLTGGSMTAISNLTAAYNTAMDNGNTNSAKNLAAALANLGASPVAGNPASYSNVTTPFDNSNAVPLGADQMNAASLAANLTNGSMTAAQVAAMYTDPNSVWPVASGSFASGGAFTNGIVNKPTLFNMGLMGEAGSEAIMPLHNIGGSLGVKAMMTTQAANDSGGSAEMLAELKQQNAQLTASIQTLQAGFKQLLTENQKQTNSLDSLQSTARQQLKVAAK
jgi:hypothetical protein